MPRLVQYWMPRLRLDDADEVESIGSSRQSGEGTSAVQPAVDADDRGLGPNDPTFGDRETGDRCFGDEVQSVGSGGGTHLANLPFSA